MYFRANKADFTKGAEDVTRGWFCRNLEKILETFWNNNFTEKKMKYI